MPQQKVEIAIPDYLGPAEREAFAAEVIDFIIRRTREDGLDKRNQPFAAYSKTYVESDEFKIAGKTSKVDLTLTGETLDSMALLDHKRGKLIIGYQRGDPINGKVEGLREGTYGASSKIGPKRDFLGITKGDLESLLDAYPAKDRAARRERVKAIEAGDIVAAEILTQAGFEDQED